MCARVCNCVFVPIFVYILSFVLFRSMYLCWQIFHGIFFIPTLWKCFIFDGFLLHYIVFTVIRVCSKYSCLAPASHHFRHWLIVLSHINISFCKWFDACSFSRPVHRTMHTLVRTTHSLCGCSPVQGASILSLSHADCVLFALWFESKCVVCFPKMVLSKRYWIKLIILFWGKQPVGGVSESFI